MGVLKKLTSKGGLLVLGLVAFGAFFLVIYISIAREEYGTSVFSMFDAAFSSPGVLSERVVVTPSPVPTTRPSFGDLLK